HVIWFAHGDAQSLSLADRKSLNACVCADDRAIGEGDFAGGFKLRFEEIRLGPAASANELRMVAAGDETNFLTVALIGHPQSQLICQRADLGFPILAKRE